MAMFHCCEPNAGGERHEQSRQCQPSARKVVVRDGGHIFVDVEVWLMDEKLSEIGAVPRED